LAAAVKVFAKSGFHGTRVSEIAKAAGVADGTIYLYFRSKEELLVSLFEDRVSKLLSYMREELPKLPDARARLRRVIELQLGLLEGERELAEVVTVILRQSTKLIHEYAAPKFASYLDAIARVVSEGHAAGAFREGESGSRHNPEFTILEWYRAKAGGGEVMRDTEELVEALTGGVVKLDDGRRRVGTRAPFTRMTVCDAFARFAKVPALETL